MSHASLDTGNGKNNLIGIRHLRVSFAVWAWRRATLQQAATCEGACQLLRDALRASGEHFRDEERRLCPAAERALGLGVLTALGEAFKKAAKAKTKGAE